MDVLCQAKSGMGKTAVFVLTTLNQLVVKEGEVSVVVMCHTRELAYQIGNEYNRFAKYMPGVKCVSVGVGSAPVWRVAWLPPRRPHAPTPRPPAPLPTPLNVQAVLFGGVPRAQHVKLVEDEKPCIIVGTPGRVMDLVESGDLKLDKVKHFILDECDKMLETLDMRKQVQAVFLKTPHEKQVMMFSATLPPEIRPVCLKVRVCRTPPLAVCGRLPRTRRSPALTPRPTPRPTPSPPPIRPHRSS